MDSFSSVATKMLSPSKGAKAASWTTIMPSSPHHGLHLWVHLHLLHPYLALETVTEDKINALTKVTSVNVQPFWPGLFAKALVSVNVGSLLCNVGLMALPPPPLLPQLRKRR